MLSAVDFDISLRPVTRSVIVVCGANIASNDAVSQQLDLYLHNQISFPIVTYLCPVVFDFRLDMDLFEENNYLRLIAGLGTKLLFSSLLAKYSNAERDLSIAGPLY